MEAREVLVEMLTENTGEHMLDSGGAYGRNWQQAKGKTVQDFENEPGVEFEGGEYPSYTISLYHYLSPQLGLDHVCREFNKLNHPCEDWDSEVYGVSIKGYDYLQGYGNIKIGESWNSYNGESSLSQVIQGAFLTIQNTPYVLLQIHGGCDVRGGYTDARLFTLEDIDNGGYLASENVHGTAKLDNEEYQISNQYDGYSLRDDDTNEELQFPEGAEVVLSMG